MKQRLLSIDLLKIMAMFAVIGLHTFCGSRGYDFAHLVYLSCVVGVPFFFMSSGYLLLGRNDICSRYIVLKIMHIFRVVFLLSFFYSIIAYYIIDTNPIILFIDCLSGAFIQRGDLWICWYLGAMMIVYILFPLINYFYINNTKSFLFFLILLFLFESTVFYFNVSESGWENKYIQTFRVWNWLFYFCLGGFIKILRSVHFNKTISIIACLFLWACNIFSHEAFVDKIGEDACEYYYCSFVVILMVASVFFLVSRITIKPYMNKIIIFFSKLFLPVYLFHPLVLFVIMHPSIFPIIHAEWMPFYMFRFLLVSFITILLSWILLMIPIVDRYLKI